MQQPSSIKKTISLRVYLLFAICVIAFAFSMGTIVVTQIKEGNYWREVAEKYQVHIKTVQAPRGIIYADNMKPLSVSTAKYSLYFDGGVANIGRTQRSLFESKKIETAKMLANIRKQHTQAHFYHLLSNTVQKQSRYKLILDNLTFDEYKQVRKIPLVAASSYLGGFILTNKEVRSFLYGEMARRTIGLYRNANNTVGIEKAYNKWLEGSSGKRLVQKISKGVYIPIDGDDITPQPGKDIVTTINIEIQDVASNSLLKQLQSLQAEWGTCIVMEVATGQIKAIASLKRNQNGNYYEEYNYAVTNIEPGSTIKTVALMGLLEDGHISLEDSININNGRWKYNGLLIKDSEHVEKIYKTSVQHAFEISSNVGISKLVDRYYKNDPKEFIKHFSDSKLNELASIKIPGEQAPNIKHPDHDTWSNTSLVWSSFGYEMNVSPLSILTFYNGVANNGKIMQPYLVKKIIKNNKIVKKIAPQVRVKKICSNSTLKKIQKALSGVVTNGTASKSRKSWYTIAGKTGTSKVYNLKHGYKVNHYLGSFAGYFPADEPAYSCIVFIQTSPNARTYYGAQTALPVFQEIADKTMARRFNRSIDKLKNKTIKKQIAHPKLNTKRANVIPNMKNWKLSDVIYFCESNQLKVKSIQGQGAVYQQSLAAGTPLNSQQSISISLQ